jgi:3-hydroxyacyl-CoA dehydrogenase/enoyl-CoA hydratase/3-hydroxybutyryl-CoA epimerase
MLNELKYKHWQISVDQNNTCWLTVDKANSSVNSMSSEMMHELESIINALEQQTNLIKALVLQSAKDSFIVGADIEEFLTFKTEQEAIDYEHFAQNVVNKFAALPFTKIAKINGFCLGGGFEIALACDYRVALDDQKVKVGLPEVTLGIIPGWGGTVRLPRLTGVFNAMNLILNASPVSPNAARKMGAIDACVSERHFQRAIEYYITQPRRQIWRPKNKLELVLTSTFGRRMVAKLLTKQVSKRVNHKHYPAPFQVIENFVKVSPFDDKAYKLEAEGISKLLVTPTARSLVRIFFLQNRLKAMGKVSEFKPQHVHVIGAGVMGGDIASWCALSGMHVTLQDTNLEAIAKTFGRAHELFNKKLKQNHLILGARDRLHADPHGQGIAVADIIIEAIVEKVEAKQALFNELEKKAKPTAVLATNTSTIPLADIAKDFKDPSRLVGIHFFNPVEKMQLVEVVYDAKTNESVKEHALAFVTKINKLPLPVKSASGFLVNRILVPYIAESITIYSEGVSGATIDKVAKNFGMMMGPIELADVVGLDVCLAAGKNLGEKLPKVLVDMVEAGTLGKKTGSGFYKYKNGRPIKDKESQNIPQDISDRLILRMVNEAMAALREGVVLDQDLVDAGMIFGSGFAPFIGGPMKYATDQGLEKVKERLDALAKVYGDRFVADKFWSEI